MNLRRPVSDEGKDGFLQRDVVPMCVHACVYMCMSVRVCVAADYPASSLAHMPSVTQPPHRNPKLGRLACTRDL